MLTLLIGVYFGGALVSFRTCLSMGLPASLAAVTAGAWPVIAILETAEDLCMRRRAARRTGAAPAATPRVTLPDEARKATR